MPNDIDILAIVLDAALNRSRRLAKRMLREAGGAGTAAELDRVLAEIAAHPRRGDIEDQAMRLCEARNQAARARSDEAARRATDGTPMGRPEWFLAEDVDDRRTWLLHLCPGGAWSFHAEVVDDEAGADWATEVYPLDAGQFLTRLLWLDGEPPPAVELKALMREARRQLRVYDAKLSV